jgi:tRNA U34 2-thiouridine synthase MnmA/TrmU
LRAKAKIRYRQEEQDCVIEILSEDFYQKITNDSENVSLKHLDTVLNSRYLVKFDKKQRAITSGQICVVYLGDELVMSGVIE